MKKLILLLLFIPIVSFGQDGNEEIEYYEKDDPSVKIIVISKFM